MILYSKTDNSTIIVEKTKNRTYLHLREWRDDQPIKDARIELDADEVEVLLNMLKNDR